MAYTLYTSPPNAGQFNVRLTLTGAGYYMFIEASNRTENEKAELISPELPAGRDFCFTLHTNMFGDSMGSIKVLIQVKPVTDR